MTLIETKNLTKSFGLKQALRGVDLSIPDGQIIGLLGPNASGKTTLLRILAGLLPPGKGEVNVMDGKTGHERKAHIAFLPDEAKLPDWMRVDDAFTYMGDMYADYDPERARALRKLMGLTENDRCRSLSKGMKERLVLGMVLARKADIYLLDEPLGGVDPAGKRTIIDAIVQMPLEGSVMIISTHLVREVEHLLDSVIFLKEGRVASSAQCEALRAKGQSIEDAYMEVFA